MAGEAQLKRLDAIAASLRERADALALLALGSVGRDTARLDEWSDLDFFVVVEAGAVERYLASLDWLSAARPVVWAFRNTVDGFKALMDDGMFCEFAVFEPATLARVPYAPGRVAWAREGVPSGIDTPVVPLPAPHHRDPEWLAGEALTNLLVGLQRWHRGERLSGARFVQVYAVDRLLELLHAGEGPGADPFVAERRLEARHPELTGAVPSWMQGVDRTCESAAAILDWLCRNVAVDAAIEGRIRELLARQLS